MSPQNIGEAKVDARKLLNQCVLVVKITHVNVMQRRIWIAVKLIKLAAYVLGTDVRVDSLIQRVIPQKAQYYFLTNKCAVCGQHIWTAQDSFCSNKCRDEWIPF